MARTPFLSALYVCLVVCLLRFAHADALASTETRRLRTSADTPRPPVHVPGSLAELLIPQSEKPSMPATPGSIAAVLASVSPAPSTRPGLVPPGQWGVETEAPTSARAASESPSTHAPGRELQQSTTQATTPLATKTTAQASPPATRLSQQQQQQQQQQKMIVAKLGSKSLRTIMAALKHANKHA